ncbi:MAG: Ig-like domain-containing protein [Spirochaetota bacterium]
MEKHKILLLIQLISLLLLFQCAPQAPTVQPNPEQSGGGGTGIGTAAPDLLNAYPANGDTSIPVDTSIVLIFSEPVDLATIVPANVTISGGVTYSASSSSDGRVVILTITSGNLSPLTPYTIDVGTGVLDQDIPQRNLITNYSITFTTSADTSTFEHPRVIAASRYPSNGANNVSINQSFVDVTFTKQVNPVTVVANASFDITPGLATGVSTTDNQTFRLQLSTSLAYNTLYTIALTAAITDSLSNPLVLDGNHTWTFTTELAPATGALTISNVWVMNITDTQAIIYWTTSTPQAAISVDYGTSSAYGSSASEPAGTRTVHQVTITGLTRTTKYYFRIQYPGPVTATGSFITADNAGTSDDDPVTDTAGDKSLVTIAQNQILATQDGSAFFAWKDPDGSVYASFIDNDAAPTKRWGADGTAVDSNNRTVLGLFPDFLGYCFVTLGDGTNIYIKRIYNNAGALAFDTVFGANAAATGLNISTGTNPAVTMLWGDQAANNVSAGFVTKVVPVGAVPNTTEMNIPWGNYFFDYDVDLSVAATGNHIIDGSYNHTTINIAGQNYRHVIGTAAGVVTATENYWIADNTSTTSFTATNHVVNTATAVTQTQTTYSNAGNNAYTDHGVNIAGWGTNDLITDGTNWGYVTANASAINLSGLVLADSGDNDFTNTNQLIDFWSFPSWLSTVYVYALVQNTTSSLYSYAITIDNNYTLTLANDIFPNSGENYSIWNGQYCWTHVPSAVSFYTIQFNPSGLISNGETVTLYNYVTGGTADTPRTNPLYDDGVDLSAVANNDIVVNLTTNNDSRVNDITYRTAGALGLVDSIMSNNQFYWILRFLNSAEPILVLGQATSTVANQLVSTSKSFGFSGLVKKGDLVYNITDNLYAVVTSVDDNDTLTLNKNIVTVGDYFIVFASNEPLIETGTVTTTGNPFTDTNANFTSANGPVQVGDIVHNLDAGTSAYVTAVNSATQLTLNNNIMTTAGHRYVIIQPRVLVAYERAGDIYGKVIRLRDGTTYLNEFTICGAAGTQANVKLITSGYTSTNTGAIALYQSGAGPTYTYYAKRINGAGVVNAADNAANGGLGVLVTPANATLLNAFSDDAGGMFILYKIANDIFVRRISSGMAISWTNTINNVVDAAMCRSGTGVIVTYNKTTNSSQIFAQGYTGAGAVAFGETTIVALTPWAYTSNLNIVPDGNGGAIISWVDERYLPQLGYAIMSQAIDSLGTRRWDADPGAGTDFDGILIGFTNIWYKPYLGLKAAFFNDGGTPYGGIFLWYDRRNNKQDIYYDINSN